MIPKSNMYRGTQKNPMQTMHDVYKLLDKFGIKERRLTQQGPETGG